MRMRAALVLTAIVAVPLTIFPAHAQDAAEFYKGRQIQLRIGSAAGSGYDLVGRLVAPYLQRHLPGNPSIIVQNAPGAGSLALANQLYTTAARDGSVIGIVTNGMPTAPLLTPDTARFDVTRFRWIGSTSPETQLIMVWHTSPVRTVEDVFKMELVVGAVAPGTAVFDMPVLLNAIAGTRFKIISGYQGTQQIDLATERGEVQGQAAVGWITVKARNQDWLREKKVRIISQYGLKPHPDLPDVPLFPMPAGAADRQALMLLMARQEYGRPLLVPPEVPADRLATLRGAFNRSMKDPDFVREAIKAGIEVNPISGEALDKLTADLVATPPDVVARVRKILEPPKSGAK